MTLTRDAAVRRVIERVGELTRDFVAQGTYPFKARGLSRAQMNLLYALSRSDAASVAELAERLHVTSGAVSQTVDGLRSVGLITSEVNPADRRGRVIRLTDEARVEVDDFERGYVEAIAPRFAALTLDDLGELDRILSRIETGSAA
jgi:DNA-binding MarR family transcriptional regulator